MQAQLRSQLSYLHAFDGVIQIMNRIVFGSIESYVGDSVVVAVGLKFQ